MKRKTFSNYRVEVDVEDDLLSVSSGDHHHRMLAKTEQVGRSIRRHLDGIGSVVPRWDTHETCSFCSATWDQPGDQYNNGCCDSDEANNPNPPEPRT